MESPLSVVSILLNSYKTLRKEVETYSRNKKVKEELLNALSSDIESFSFAFDVLADVEDTMLMPSLEAFKMGDSTPSKINAVVESCTEMYFAYARLMEYFVKLAEACKSVTQNPAFMKHLMEANQFLFDFVNQMALLSKLKGKVVIDKDFFYFVRLYEKQMSPQVANEDVDSLVEVARDYVKLVNNRIKPFIRKSSIKRSTAKRFFDSLRELKKAHERIKVAKAILQDLKGYVPSQFVSIAVFVEELFPEEDERERARNRAQKSSFRKRK